jgi:predicted dithiol-disulfide oxidoreductase (DUF899 family)
VPGVPGGVRIGLDGIGPFNLRGNSIAGVVAGSVRGLAFRGCVEIRDEHVSLRSRPALRNPACFRFLEKERGSTMTKIKVALPKIVSRAEWQAARDRLLVKEKEATRALDKLAAERRRLPMVKIEKNYVFEGPDGKASLLDLFDGRRQLFLYHFMFGPGAKPCTGCSSMMDNVGHLAHLNARDTSFAVVARAPLSEIEAYKQRMAWNFPWYSSHGTDFNHDFGVTTDKGENFGISVFLRDGTDIYRTYFTSARGADRLRFDFNVLDLTPLGRQESWEDSPEGWPQTPPYEWWRKHDEYQETTKR